MTLVVTGRDTAAAFGSGDVDVLATPRLVALCEQATVLAIAATLAEDETTVGVRVELDHLRPSYVGATVTAHATLADIDGARLRFDVEADEGEKPIAHGVVVRVVVERSRYTPNVDRG